MGRPGCPELAFSMASIAKNLIVLTDLSMSAVSVLSKVSTAAEAIIGRRMVAGMLRWREMENVVVEVDFRPEKEEMNKEEELGEPWRGLAARDSMVLTQVTEVSLDNNYKVYRVYNHKTNYNIPTFLYRSPNPYLFLYNAQD